MIVPPIPDDKLCARCGHRFDEHDVSECGCLLKCQKCNCADFDHLEGVTFLLGLGKGVATGND